MEAHAVTYPVPGSAYCLVKRHRIIFCPSENETAMASQAAMARAVDAMG